MSTLGKKSNSKGQARKERDATLSFFVRMLREEGEESDEDAGLGLTDNSSPGKVTGVGRDRSAESRSNAGKS